MTKLKQISDYNHPLVKETALKIIKDKHTVEEKVEAIFYYVRDHIKFGFLKYIDLYEASEIIKAKKGQCNNKCGLFLALCKAVDIESRIHFSGIKKEIQRGVFTGIVYRLMPKEISHSWVEVKIKDKWISFDSFINDLEFYRAGKNELQRRGWKTGLSVSCEKGDSSAEFSLDNKSFVQMDAITDDHGVYDDPMDYYNSPNHKNHPNWIKVLIYRLSLRGINKRVEQIRRSMK